MAKIKGAFLENVITVAGVKLSHAAVTFRLSRCRSLAELFLECGYTPQQRYLEPPICSLRQRKREFQHYRLDILRLNEIK